jgi:adenine-specific DNA-methyltransferase
MFKENLLIKADNLIGLEFLLKNEYAEKIDLVYIDPPFATNNNFYVSDNRVSTISHSNGKLAYSDKFSLDEYLDFLENRLILIKKLLSSRGSIYLHIDYKIGHYVKILMDKIFGIENFRNDISRIKCNPKNFKKIGYGNIKDMILFYTKTDNPIWNEPYIPYNEEDIKKLFPKVDKRTGKRYTTVPIHAPGEIKNPKPFKGIFPPKGRHWRVNVETLEKWDKEGLLEWSKKGNPRKKIYADDKKGKRVQDIWEFKDPQNPIYPTQKNEKMLELIIKTSSNENSIVLDCFCGSGTTLKVAERLNRKWIGIDNSDVAISIAKKQLNNNLFQNFHYLEF